MKIWIVNNKTVFQDEKSFMDFVTKSKTKSEKVQILEAEVIEETTVSDLFKSTVESNLRDHKIQAVMSNDVFFDNIERLKTLYPKYNTDSESKFLDTLNMNIHDKNKVTKLIKSNSEHLFKMSTEIEWFESLILVGITESLDSYTVKSNGYNTRVSVSKKTKDKFLKAKKNVQKAV